MLLPRQVAWHFLCASVCRDPSHFALSEDEVSTPSIYRTGFSMLLGCTADSMQARPLIDQQEEVFQEFPAIPLRVRLDQKAVTPGPKLVIARWKSWQVVRLQSLKLKNCNMTLNGFGRKTDPPFKSTNTAVSSRYSQQVTSKFRALFIIGQGLDATLSQ